MSKERYSPAKLVRKFYPLAVCLAGGSGFTVIPSRTDPVTLGSSSTRFGAWHEAWCVGCYRQRLAEGKREST